MYAKIPLNKCGGPVEKGDALPGMPGGAPPSLSRKVKKGIDIWRTEPVDNFIICKNRYSPQKVNDKECRLTARQKRISKQSVAQDQYLQTKTQSKISLSVPLTAFYNYNFSLHSTSQVLLTPNGMLDYIFQDFPVAITLSTRSGILFNNKLINPSKS